MIDKNYRENALKTYGESCEICGHRTSLEVHHINYQDQQQMEDLLRRAKKYYVEADFQKLLAEANSMGFVEFEKNQLAKDDSTKNLSVLCGNCHSLVHTMDVGNRLLKAIKPRK